MTNAREPPVMCYHVAVYMKNCIIVFGGEEKKDEGHSLRCIWMYNVYTEQWGKHVIPDRKTVPPATGCPYATMIKTDLFMFGGYHFRKERVTNALWKLIQTPNQCFQWIRVKTQSKKKTPSPRCFHSGWEYAGQLWTFGGSGPIS